VPPHVRFVAAGFSVRALPGWTPVRLRPSIARGPGARVRRPPVGGAPGADRHHGRADRARPPHAGPPAGRGRDDIRRAVRAAGAERRWQPDGSSAELGLPDDEDRPAFAVGIPGGIRQPPHVERGPGMKKIYVLDTNVLL